jgi:hypothetical protein
VIGMLRELPLGDGLICRVSSVHMGVTDVDVQLRGVTVATVRWTAAPQLWTIIAFQTLPGAPVGLELTVIEGVIDGLYGGSPPPALFHLCVRGEQVLAWFHAAPWAAGVLVSGLVNGRQLDRYPLRRLGREELRIAGPNAVVLSYERALIGQVRMLADGRLPDLVTGWHLGNVQYRETMMHRALLESSVPSELCDTLHMMGLADMRGPVRHTAAGYLRGTMSPNQTWTPGLEHFFAFLGRPLIELQRRGGVAGHTGGEFDDVRARSSARLAVFFAICNPLLTMREPMGRLVERHLNASLVELGVERDRWLYDLAVGSLDEEEGGAGIGVDARIDLLDLARFCVHRHRLLCRIDRMRYDKHYWLMMAVDGLCRSAMSPIRMTGPDERELARALYGPSPTSPMPRRRSGVPDASKLRPGLHVWPSECG